MQQNMEFIGNCKLAVIVEALLGIFHFVTIFVHLSSIVTKVPTVERL